MIRYASSRFWACYNELPEEVRTLADKQFALLQANPSHPSLHLKKAEKLIGKEARSLARCLDDIRRSRMRTATLSPAASAFAKATAD